MGHKKGSVRINDQNRQLQQRHEANEELVRRMRDQAQASREAFVPLAEQTCKYGSRCRDPEACGRIHPTETPLAEQTCKFGSRCRDPEACGRIHPIETEASTSKVACRFGDDCWNRDCVYGHHCTNCNQACPKDYLHSTNRCPYAPGRELCRFGDKCERGRCWFAHSQELSNSIQAFGSDRGPLMFAHYHKIIALALSDIDRKQASKLGEANE